MKVYIQKLIWLMVLVCGPALVLVVLLKNLKFNKSIKI